MPQVKEIESVTVVTRENGLIFIKTMYPSGEGYISVFIASTSGSLGSVNYYEGDLVIQVTNYDVSFLINGSGELVAYGGIANQFSINTDGELIFNNGIMIQNLGQVSSLYKGSSAPANTQIMWFNTTNSKYYTYDTGTSIWQEISITAGNFMRSDRVAVTAGTHTVTYSTPFLPGVIYSLNVYDESGVGVGVVSSDEDGFTYESLGAGYITYLAVIKV